jgi:hypothetical protein
MLKLPLTPRHHWRWRKDPSHTPPDIVSHGRVLEQRDSEISIFFVLLVSYVLTLEPHSSIVITLLILYAKYKLCRDSVRFGDGNT